LSLRGVEKKHKALYNSSMKTGFVVHKADGSNRVFMPAEMGLYFSDVKNDTEHVMINTVDSIKNKYTVKEYANARKGHSIKNIIGKPATKDYIKCIEGGLIRNCPITKRDILRAKEGPNLGSLKENNTKNSRMSNLTECVWNTGTSC